MGFPMLMEEYGGEAPHTVSTLYAKVFPDPRGRPSLKNHTQQQNHTAFKYPASRSPLPYGCIEFAMGSSALELRGAHGAPDVHGGMCGGGGGRTPPYGFNNIFEGFPGPPRSAKPQENTPKKEARLPSSIWPPGLNCLTGVSKSPGIPAPSNSHCPRAGLGDERQIATSTLSNHINVVRFWAGLRPKFVPDRFQRTRFRKCYTDQRRLLRETDSKAPGQESEIRP